MANFRAIPTKIWADDTFLSMSPEQKLIFIYLHTSPYVTQCGIYKLQLKTMGFHLGYMSSPVESALAGFCLAFPDFVAWDKETGEVALLQYPNLFLKDAPQKIWNYVVKELAEVQSIELLKRVIEKSSATTSKPYLSRLRSLNMEIQNARRENENTLLDIDVAQEVESQEVTSEIEKKRKEKKEKGKDTLDFSPDAYKKTANRFVIYYRKNICEDFTEWRFALPYFQNLQKKGEWFELREPNDAADWQRWIGKHYAGIVQWAKREPVFNPNVNKDQPAVYQKREQ